jgi:hypothetical protein
MKSAMKTHAARSRGGIVWNDTLEVRVAERARRALASPRASVVSGMPKSHDATSPALVHRL